MNVKPGDRRKLHVGGRVEEIEIRYADDDVIVFVGENGRWDLATPEVFEHETADVQPPSTFWIELEYHRERNEWYVPPGPLREEPRVVHTDKVKEHYAVHVTITAPPIALRYVSQAARQDVVPSPET